MRRVVGVVLAAAALLAAAPQPASAAEPKRPSAALRNYGLDWIQYIPEKSLPPTRYAVCIVDTGVAITPDTPPDNPNGPILLRTSVDGASGEPEGNTPAHGHGTRMTSTVSAPRNGWGHVGVFPLAKVIAVRATIHGEGTFRTRSYARGIQECIKLAASFPIAAISLAIGCGDCNPTDDDIRRVSDRVRAAATQGLPVIVAAGNASGPLRFPANVSGVLPVAAGGKRGRLCPYAAFGPEVFVLAPACPVPAAEPFSGAFEPASDGGSSVATAEVAALFAALRTMRPTATTGDVIRWIVSGRSSDPTHRRLDGLRVAQAAGLGGLARRAARAARRR